MGGGSAAGSVGAIARAARWPIPGLLAVAFVVWGLLLPPSLAWAAAQRHALLVGIGQYQDRDVPGLAGPANDVAALRDVLQRRWGFQASHVRTLLDAQATKARILAELDALVSRGAPGDEVLIYFSGHGSSRLDAAADAAPVPHGSGALLAYDFSPDTTRLAKGEGLVIGRHNLVPRILALEAAGRHLWVVMDACYSGQSVREAQGATRRSELPKRAVTLSRPHAGEELAALHQRMGSRGVAPPYPYRATAFLSAADEGETARDIPPAWLKQMPTLDNQPHGAFTDALLRVLEGQLPADLNADGRMDLNEVHRAVSDFMATRPYAHTPQRLPALEEDPHNLSTRPVLAVEGAATKPARRSPVAMSLFAETLPTSLAQRLAGLPGVARAARGEDAQLAVLPSPGSPALLDVIDTAGDLRRRWKVDEVDGLAGHVRQLAWLHRLRAQAEGASRGTLGMGFTPSRGQGDTFAVGQEFSLSLKPEHAGWLVVFNQESDGRFVPVYPLAPYQTGELKAHAAWTSRVWKVAPPEGKDTQFGFLFMDRPKDLDEWVRLAYGKPELSGPRQQILIERMLADNAGRYSFGHSTFRTVPRP